MVTGQILKSMGSKDIRCSLLPCLGQRPLQLPTRLTEFKRRQASSSCAPVRPERHRSQRDPQLRPPGIPSRSCEALLLTGHAKATGSPRVLVSGHLLLTPTSFPVAAQGGRWCLLQFTGAQNGSSDRLGLDQTEGGSSHERLSGSS